MTSPFITTVTVKQHVLLLCLTLAGVCLALFLIQSHKVTPTIKDLTIELATVNQQLAYQQSRLATREAMDLPSMRRAVGDAREKLRTAEIGGVIKGAPFLDATNLSKVAAFQSLISTCAVENHLFIKKHGAVTEPDQKLKDMIVKSLEVRGKFSDLHQFIRVLENLPNRVVILSIEIALDPQYPGHLNAVMRYSV